MNTNRSAKTLHAAESFTVDQSMVRVEGINRIRIPGMLPRAPPQRWEGDRDSPVLPTGQCQGMRKLRFQLYRPLRLQTPSQRSRRREARLRDRAYGQERWRDSPHRKSRHSLY